MTTYNRCTLRWYEQARLQALLEQLLICCCCNCDNARSCLRSFIHVTEQQRCWI